MRLAQDQSIWQALETYSVHLSVDVMMEVANQEMEESGLIRRILQNFANTPKKVVKVF